MTESVDGVCRTKEDRAALAVREYVENHRAELAAAVMASLVRRANSPTPSSIGWPDVVARATVITKCTVTSGTGHPNRLREGCPSQ